ncbi:GNAT family N-acetyltransferase [Shewanella corallii]|uniref:GNAT family N-acetyltransferase n=1 Tax=Shewanella corallii TaxID=560080 RepID=A0ABT0N6M5_9GAMM|nr:GNAT family N-acetyltransferase [Shewanella corallii]MCL2914059.1 GNAT family N-acetyltransferase [Shewanella corallii]
MPNTTQIIIRRANCDDYDAIADVMFNAVREGHSEYTEEQRQAWVPERRSGTDWIARLDSQEIMIAVNANQVVGFMSLAAKGYIDFAYIRPSAQGTGLFRRLYESIETLSLQNGLTRLWVHASLMAQPAFSAMGFAITQKQVVQIGEESFERFEMEKLFDHEKPHR